MKQSFIKRMSLLAVLLVMTFGAFAQTFTEMQLPGDGVRVASYDQEPTRNAAWLSHLPEGTSATQVFGNSSTINLGYYVRFSTADLAPFVGQYISKLRIPTRSSTSITTNFGTGGIRARVFTGGSESPLAPGTMILDQVMPTGSYCIGFDNYVDLDEPILITGTEEIWIGIQCSTLVGYPVNSPTPPAAGYVVNKTALLFYSNAWYDVASLFGGAQAVFNIAAYTRDGLPINTCDITIEMEDYFADGWNGAELAFVDEDGIEWDRQTLSGGASKTTTVTLPRGKEIDVNYTAALYDDEISFTIYDAEDNELYDCQECEPANGLLFSFTNNCPLAAAGEVVATEVDATTVHLAWEPNSTTDLTGFEVYRKLTSEADWANAELLGTITAAQLQYMDYTWEEADFGVYHWGVQANYSSAPSELYVSNALDKDMLTEVDVTVTLNSGEAATGTVVTFTNTSEPDLDLVYEATLPSTGKFAWDEFRKGTYDIVVKYPGFTMITEVDVLIETEESFSWVMEEKLTEAIDLYVTPTALASWGAPVFTTFHETFDNGIPSTWTVINNGNKPLGAWTALTEYGSTYSLNSTPFAMADSDAAGSGSVCNEILMTPVINVSMCDELYLSFIQYYRHLGLTFAKVEVYDGSAWVTVLNQTSTVGSWTSPNVKEIDVTAYINSAFQVRFHYTGNWAYYWAIDDVMITAVPTKARSLEQYKVYLDGTFITNTTETSYQFDVTNLVAGDSYYAEIMVDYTTGQSTKIGYQFVYEGCDAYDAPTALAAEQPIGTKNAVLTWTNPDLTDVDFLRIYRNGTLYRDNLSMDTPFSAWTDVTLDNGTYNYALQLVYDDGAETCMDAATKSITIVSTGTIKGAVTYQLGGNVQGATITVSNTDKTYTFTTAADGTYSGTVEAGTYTVKCEMEGHVSQTANATVLYVGTTTVDFGLYETPVAVEGVTATLQDNGTVYVAWDGSTGGGGGGGGEDLARIELAANDTWGDGSGYVMLFDADANMYPEMPSGNFGGTMPASFFNEFEYTLPEGATNTFATPSVVTGSAYIDIPAGTYDYVIVNPDGSNTWVAGAAGNANSKADNYVFEANKKYTFTMIYDAGLDNDGPNLVVEDFDFGKATAMNIVYPRPIVTDNSPVEQVSMDASVNKSIENVKELSAEEVAARIAANNAVQTTKDTRALTGYNVYRTGCYGGEPELLASLPISATNFYDNNWSNLDFGVYKWGVVATYDLNESEIVYSNCIDKDMYTEVSVTVNLNTAESPEGTKVMFTNISEPDMELVYEIELDETGYFLFEEFRKGEYDILVTKYGYEPLEIAAEEIVEATDFVWVLEELIEPVLDLYVSPTGYAMWEMSAPEVFEGFYESFDEGIPETWTIEKGGNSVTTWRGLSGANSLNGTPFAEANSENPIYCVADDKLYSPVVDASGASELYLSFIHFFKVYSDDKADVLVFDGSNWVSVYSRTSGIGAWGSPDAQEIDVTAYANENFQVCFHYYSVWGWHWAIDDVMLSDSPAKDRAVQYSKVWLDGIFCDDVVGTTYQHDVTNLVEDQEYTTEVAIVYTTGVSEKVSYTWTYTPCENYPGATTFTAELDGENAKLNWVLPGSTGGGGTGYEGWMNYCINDEVAGRIGYSASAGEDMTMAIRFTPSDLSTYGVESGQTITKVALGMGQELANVNTMEILFWEGGSSITDAGTLIYTQAITNFTTFSDNTMVDIPLTTPVTVDPSKELRVGWRLVNTAGYPFGRDAGPVAEPGKSDLFKCSSLNGGAWVSYSAVYGWSNNICIKAFVSGSGKSIVLGEDYISNSNTPAVSIATAVEVPQSQVLFSKGELVGVSSNKVAINNSKDMLYNNDVPTTTSGLITVQFSTGELVQIADDFDGLAGWTIDKIVTAGFNNQGNLPSVFGVAFYEDNSGVPGTELYSNTNCAATEVDGIFTITLPEAYILPEDGKYWISMYAVRATGGLDIGNWRFDIYTSTTAIGSKLHLCDHNDLFGTGNTNWQSVDPGLVAGVVSMTFELHGVIGTPPNPGIEEPIIGVNIYRDGEFLAFVAENTTTYTDEGMPYGEHEYCVQVVYESYAMSCIDNMLCDEVERPYPCEAPTNLAGEYVEADGVFGGYVTWGSIPAEPIFEDVESHTAFTVNSPGSIGWSYIDGDASSTYGFNGISFENTGGAMSFIVFDPKLTTPEMYTSTPTIHAHSGDKFFASFAATSAPNNDWIISPELSGATKISFWAKSYMSDYGLERFKVSYSTTNASQGSFTVLSTGSYVEAPLDWTFYQYDIPSGAKYVAITCVSNDAFIFMLDDISIEVGGKSITLDAEDFNTTVVSNEPVSAIAQRSILSDEQIAKYAQPVVDNSPQVTRNIQGYNVYRALIETKDYSLIATVPFEEGITEYFYYDTNVLAQETYDYQVTAVYVYEDGYECESEAALTPEGDDHVSIFMDYGIEDHNTDSRIYPNPASNYITVEATNMNRITVMSVVGQVVYDVKVDSNQERINVSNLKSGVYVVRISSEAGVSSERITIVR